MSTDHHTSRRFQLYKRVIVNHGPLSGLTGVLSGFRGDRCLIDLDATARGVFLLIDASTVNPLDRGQPADYRAKPAD